MLFLFVPQESWDLQLRMFGYVILRISEKLQLLFASYEIFHLSLSLDRGGFGGWNADQAKC